MLMEEHMKFELKVKLIKGIGPRMEMQDHGCFDPSVDNAFSWAIVCDGIGGKREVNGQQE